MAVMLITLTVMPALKARAAGGDLNLTFGLAGVVSNNFGGGDNYVNCVGLQTDGKLLVGGGIANGFGLARYQEDGSLDLTFGDGGRVMTDFLGLADGARAVAVQPDGRIVAAGYAPTTGTMDFALARYVGAAREK